MEVMQPRVGQVVCTKLRAGWRVQGTQSIGSLSSGDLEDPDFSKEQDLELKCARAFKAVLHFEQTHCLQVEVRCWRCPASVHHPEAVILGSCVMYDLTACAQGLSSVLLWDILCYGVLMPGLDPGSRSQAVKWSIYTICYDKPVALDQSLC